MSRKIVSCRAEWLVVSFLLVGIVLLSAAPIAKAATIIGNDPAVPISACGAGSCTSSMSWTHIVGTNLNRILIVGISEHSTLAVSVTAVTYGGLPLTSLSPQTGTGSLKEFLVQQWYLLNPPSGANTVVVTFASTPDDVLAASASFFNVGGVRGSNGATGTTGLAIVTVNASTGDLVVDTLAAEPTGDTPGAGQTVLWDQGDPNDNEAAGSYQPASSPVTMQWTISPVTWGLVAVVLQPPQPAAIPEYPLGLPLLAIFMVIAYGLVKRRTSKN